MTHQLAQAIAAGRTAPKPPDSDRPDLVLADCRDGDREPWHGRIAQWMRPAPRRVPKHGRSLVVRMAHRYPYGPGRTW